MIGSPRRRGLGARGATPPTAQPRPATDTEPLHVGEIFRALLADNIDATDPRLLPRTTDTKDHP